MNCWKYLASGSIVDFLEFAAESAWINHLQSYGIVSIAKSGRPNFQIGVIQQYVAIERAKRLRSSELRSIISQDKRQEFLSRRIPNLLSDMKMFLRAVEKRESCNHMAIQLYKKLI